MFCESDPDTHPAGWWLEEQACCPEGKMWWSGPQMLPGECGSAPASVSVRSPQMALSKQRIPSQEADLRACAVGQVPDGDDKQHRGIMQTWLRETV